jgi:hypothetical protein
MNSKITPRPLHSQLDDERIAVYETLAQAREQFGENYAGFLSLREEELLPTGKKGSEP